MGANLDAMNATATYVYCIVAVASRPRMTRSRAGLQGLGAVRLLPMAPAEPADEPSTRAARPLRLFAVVADAPLAAYSEAAIARGLTDLEWVSRAAIAHEAVVESFIASPAVLPMKLFTIFSSDARAIAHLARQRPQLQAVAARVQGHREWGIRVVLDRAGAVTAAAPLRSNRRPADATASGAGYLQRKKAQHDAVGDLARRAHEVVTDLYDRLARAATQATRRAATTMPPPGAPLLLDAAYLVPTTRSRTFQSTAARQARALKPRGYVVTLTGPWPPYSFMEG
jgi:hypothetical protein